MRKNHKAYLEYQKAYREKRKKEWPGLDDRLKRSWYERNREKILARAKERYQLNKNRHVNK